MSAGGKLWTPVGVLVVGAALSVGIQQQATMELRGPLAEALPSSWDGRLGEVIEVSQAEARVAAFTDYAIRAYEADSSQVTDETRPSWISAYVGYYDSQTQGRTIHSPRNCLPGSGWEALSSRPETLASEGESFTVNRYVLQNGDDRALVLYWYQGRGRVAHNEYLVKWDLLRDAAIKRRTDEALVRIVVPIEASEEASFDYAVDLALHVKTTVDQALPL